MEGNDSDSELEKPFDDTSKRHETKEPIKERQTKTRDVKSIEPSSGFENSLKNKSTKIETNESASSRKSERQRTARVMYEPALTTTDENLNPTITEFDQLMSCLEQDIKKQSQVSSTILMKMIF